MTARESLEACVVALEKSADGNPYWTAQFERMARDLVTEHHAELARALEDAERYRWLRDATELDWTVSQDDPRGGCRQHIGYVIDAAIDAARGGQGRG